VQLLKTADAAKKNPLDEVEETPCGGGIPPPPPPCTSEGLNNLILIN